MGGNSLVDPQRAMELGVRCYDVGIRAVAARGARHHPFATIQVTSSPERGVDHSEHHCQHMRPDHRVRFCVQPGEVLATSLEDIAPGGWSLCPGCAEADSYIEDATVDPVRSAWWMAMGEIGMAAMAADYARTASAALDALQARQDAGEELGDADLTTAATDVAEVAVILGVHPCAPVSFELAGSLEWVEERVAPLFTGATLPQECDPAALAELRAHLDLAHADQRAATRDLETIAARWRALLDKGPSTVTALRAGRASSHRVPEWLGPVRTAALLTADVIADEQDLVLLTLPRDVAASIGGELPELLPAGTANVPTGPGCAGGIDPLVGRAALAIVAVTDPGGTRLAEVSLSTALAAAAAAHGPHDVALSAR